MEEPTEPVGSAKPRRAGRPELSPKNHAPERPVLSNRVSRELYDQLAESAQRSGRKLGEETTYRLEQSFVWERAHGDVAALLAKAKETIAANAKKALDDQLKDAGFTFVRSAVTGEGAWFPPSVDSITWILDNGVNLQLVEELMMRTASRAVSKNMHVVRALMEQVFPRKRINARGAIDQGAIDPDTVDLDSKP